MNKYQSILLSLVLTCFNVSVLAEPLSYDFVSLKYSVFSSQLDGYPDDLRGEGVTLDFSLAVSPSVAVVASYGLGRADINLSGTDADTDVRSASFGLLVHLPIDDKTDFILGLSFLNGEIDVDSPLLSGEDADGGMTIIGIRQKLSEQFEINGYVRRRALEQESYFGIHLGTAYYAHQSLSIDATLSIDSDTQSLALGVSKYF